jgi:deoxyribose-phosphate aldolase
VGAAAAEFCALIVAPIPAKLAAVALSASGAVVTYDIGFPLGGYHMRMKTRGFHTPASGFVE